MSVQLFQSIRVRRIRTGFTLIEILVSIVITGIIGSMLAVAITGANRHASGQRAETQVDRLSMLMLQIYEEETERMIAAPVSTPQPVPSANAIADKTRRLAMLNWQRDYLRCTLPDRIQDLRDFPIEVVYNLYRGFGGAAEVRGARIDPSYDPPAPPIGSAPPSWPSIVTGSTRWQAQQRYRQRVFRMVLASRPPTAPSDFSDCVDGNDNNGEWTTEYQSAECLYLILATHVVNGEPAIDSLNARDIGDLDEDGVPEVLDPWGTPLGFIRWPVGYYLWKDWYPESDYPLSSPPLPTPADLASLKTQLGKDPLDILYADPRYDDTSIANHQADDPFPIVPIIVSAGDDNVFDLVGLDDPPLAPIRYAQGTFPVTPNGTLAFPGGTRFIDPYQYGVPIHERLGAVRDTDDPETDNASDNVYSSF